MFNNFIIIGDDPIVRMDLTGLLQASFPASRIEAGATVQDVSDTLLGCGPDTVLFIKGSLLDRSAETARVVIAAASRGCQIMTLGSPKNVVVSSITIEQPFTDEIVLAALQPESVNSPLKRCS